MQEPRSGRYKHKGSEIIDIVALIQWRVLCLRCAADLPRLRFGVAFGTICVGETHGACED